MPSAPPSTPLPTRSYPTIAFVLKAIGGLRAQTGHPLDAARLWGQSEKIMQSHNEPMSIPDRERLDAQVAAARAALKDDAAFDATWQEGRAMSIDEAAALARQEAGQ